MAPLSWLRGELHGAMWAGSGPAEATGVAFEDEREYEENAPHVCCKLSGGPFKRLVFFSGWFRDATQAQR